MNNYSFLAAKPDILVVDDNRENLRLLSTMLSDVGYRVRKAINGNIAFRTIESGKPDLILLDINMPDLTGYEVCRQLKSVPEIAEIPVIFISAYDEVLDKVKAFEVGGVDYITKPFKIQEVLVRIKTHLTIYWQQKQLIKQQKQLLAQNAQLQLLLTTTKAISKADNFQSALEVTLAQIGEKLDFDFGEAWIPNSIATVFELGEGWYTSDPCFEVFRHKTKKMAFATNRDFLREICLNKQPCWMTDVSVEPCDVFNRNQLADEVGLRSCLGVPILLDKQVLAVLVFFKREASVPESRSLELVNYLATQLSSSIAHKRAESTLRETQQQFEAMAANIPGCVYRGVVHANGRMKLLYISEGEHELSGLNPQQAMHEPNHLLDTISPKSQADFYEALKVAAKSNKPIIQEYAIASPDGEVKWVRNSARYSLMENGDVMVDGVAIDISDGVAVKERLRNLEEAIASGTEPHASE